MRQLLVAQLAFLLCWLAGPLPAFAVGDVILLLVEPEGATELADALQIELAAREVSVILLHPPGGATVEEQASAARRAVRATGARNAVWIDGSNQELTVRVVGRSEELLRHAPLDGEVEPRTFAVIASSLLEEPTTPSADHPGAPPPTDEEEPEVAADDPYYLALPPAPTWSEQTNPPMPSSVLAMSASDPHRDRSPAPAEEEGDGILQRHGAVLGLGVGTAFSVHDLAASLTAHVTESLRFGGRLAIGFGEWGFGSLGFVVEHISDDQFMRFDYGGQFAVFTGSMPNPEPPDPATVYYGYPTTDNQHLFGAVLGGYCGVAAELDRYFALFGRVSLDLALDIGDGDFLPMVFFTLGAEVPLA